MPRPLARVPPPPRATHGAPDTAPHGATGPPASSPPRQPRFSPASPRRTKPRAGSGFLSAKNEFKQFQPKASCAFIEHSVPSSDGFEVQLQRNSAAATRAAASLQTNRKSPGVAFFLLLWFCSPTRARTTGAYASFFRLVPAATLPAHSPHITPHPVLADFSRTNDGLTRDRGYGIGLTRDRRYRCGLTRDRKYRCGLSPSSTSPRALPPRPAPDDACRPR